VLAAGARTDWPFTPVVNSRQQPSIRQTIGEGPDCMDYFIPKCAAANHDEPVLRWWALAGSNRGPPACKAGEVP
jgi:hypothetical protein